MNIEFKISKKPINYKKALKLLEKRVNKVKKGGRELVWFLEHPITYTGGIRSKDSEILDKSIKVFNIDPSMRNELLNLYKILSPYKEVPETLKTLKKKKHSIRRKKRKSK